MNEFAGLSNADLVRSLDSEQKELLKRFFGMGLAGARERQKQFLLPDGLTRVTLQKYRQIARRQVERGLDSNGTQALRIELIDKALEGMA